MCFDMSTLRTIAKRKYGVSYSHELLVYLEFNLYVWGSINLYSCETSRVPCTVKTCDKIPIHLQV